MFFTYKYVSWNSAEKVGILRKIIGILRLKSEFWGKSQNTEIFQKQKDVQISFQNSDFSFLP